MIEIKFKYIFSAMEYEDICSYIYTLNEITDGKPLETLQNLIGLCGGLLWVIKDRLQYTGLKDKNGVEIFEGDILNLTEDGKYLSVVKWNQKTCAFCCGWLGGNKDSDHLYGAEMAEVIGNIHENPELIEVEK